MFAVLPPRSHIIIIYIYTSMPKGQSPCIGHFQSTSGEKVETSGQLCRDRIVLALTKVDQTIPLARQWTGDTIQCSHGNSYTVYTYILYMYMYKTTRIYMYMYVYTCTYVHVYTQVHTHTYIYIVWHEI